jgi:hypothetical protein
MRIRASKILNTLSEICSSYSDDPANEINKLANIGYSEGTINLPRYEVLQYRVPFPGFEKKTLKELGLKLNVTGNRVRQLEKSASFIIMRKYLKDRWSYDENNNIVIIDSG